MLRVNLLQNWFSVSVPAQEEALYEITSMPQFALPADGPSPLSDLLLQDREKLATTVTLTCWRRCLRHYFFLHCLAKTTTATVQSGFFSPVATDSNESGRVSGNQSILTQCSPGFAPLAMCCSRDGMEGKESGSAVLYALPMKTPREMISQTYTERIEQLWRAYLKQHHDMPVKFGIIGV